MDEQSNKIDQEKSIPKYLMSHLCRCCESEIPSEEYEATKSDYCKECDKPDVCFYSGEEFCKKKDLITIDIKNFNPQDKRIQLLIDGFQKKAEELGFKTGDCTVDSRGTQQIWDSKNWTVYLGSY